MTMLVEALAGWGVAKVADTLWNGAGSQLKEKLKKTDLERAIASGIAATQEREKRLEPQAWLFFHCEPHKVPKLLDQLFTDAGVRDELLRPLRNEGKPQVPFLVEVFKREAIAAKVELNEASLEPWVEVFTNAFFEKTSTYLQFQIAKKDYFAQLASWFDDVKFAGFAVEGQEIEKSEKLAHIFVMPDVVEDVQRGSSSWLEQELLMEGVGNRQTELLREQRWRSQLDRSGRKFLAAQLLSQSQAQKVVLLGAPGSGKTTLMSYFAVMLAQKQPERLGLAAGTDWLPILIRMRAWATQPDMNPLDYARQFAEKTMSVKPLPSGFFEYWLEDGQALILLDGLDEVPEAILSHSDSLKPNHHNAFSSHIPTSLRISWG